ncbi:MAG: FAD binding domain-containing protein [Myxococcaceae bacterium]
MLTLPAFAYHAPASLEEAIGLLAAHRGDVKVLAGGTDLLPNMKHRLFTPGHLVGLRGVPGLAEARIEGGSLRLGAMISIARLSRDPLVRGHFPSLAQAAGAIAGPQLREMGTLGGNLCLDTRCVYYNQTAFWRKALGYCLKKDGTVCHVVKAGRRCVAAASNDTAPALISLGASVRLAGPQGIRELPLEGFYVADGLANTVLREGELVVEVRLPLPGGKLLAGYQKLRVREAIDYPALSVAVAAGLDGADRLEWVRVVVSALGARPHGVKGLEVFAGRALDEAAVDELGRLAHRQCHPLGSINVDPAWRRELVPVLVRRAFASAAGQR